ncbi:MAG: hypothetical protein HY653_03990 [Acidobacteria bacterium]|nr:hypothetical protein [Acidobacteriota bacterium]
MRVTLNLATRPASGQRRFWLLGGLAGSAVLALTVWVGAQAWHYWQEGADLRARNAELRDGVKELRAQQSELEARLRAPGAREVVERAAFYNHLLQRKVVSWAQLFVALEKHLPDQVRILAVTPQLDPDGRLRLELRVGAQSAQALVRFLHELEQGESFAEVAVRSQQRSERAGPDVVVAEVSASYRGGG